MRRLILAFLLLAWIGMILACSGGSKTQNSADIKPTKVDDLRGAVELTRKARVNFNHKFSNERLEFTAKVYSVQDHRRNGEGWGVIANPVDPSDDSVVLTCWFDDKGATGIGKAQKGDRVKISGSLRIGSRDDKGSVLLDFHECELK